MSLEPNGCWSGMIAMPIVVEPTSSQVSVRPPPAIVHDRLKVPAGGGPSATRASGNPESSPQLAAATTMARTARRPIMASGYQLLFHEDEVAGLLRQPMQVRRGADLAVAEP